MASQNHNADEVSETDKLRGYKVYRVQRSDGEDPWRFEVQGVYGERGELLRQQQNVNKTCELVPRETKGELRIAFRGLSTRELALLLQACAVPWRLGGGKPLGLGLGAVIIVASVLYGIEFRGVVPAVGDACWRMA